MKNAERRMIMSNAAIKKKAKIAFAWYQLHNTFAAYPNEKGIDGMLIGKEV